MKIKLLIPFIPYLMLLTGCSKPQADLILHNGHIFTVDSLFTQTESLVVKDGKIIASGKSEDMLSQFQAGQIIDLQGKYAYPGFIDAHAHFYGYGMNLLQSADLTGTTSQDEICAVLKKHYETYGGAWLLGRGWDQNDWPDRKFPDREILDRYFPDVPVCLTRVDGHASWVNSRALALAGVTRETKVKGGEVLLKNGEPSGILIDNAESLVSSVIPKPDAALQAKALSEAGVNCARAGLTSVTDCGVSYDVIALMDTLHKEGKLKIRINAMINPDPETISRYLDQGIHKTERLQVNTVKIYADGALGSRGALMLEPYADDPENCGLQIESQAFYDDICRKAYEKNYQVAVHCIGDSANRLILNTYAKFLKGKNDRRWRIEHAQVIHPDDFGLFGAYSIVPSVQATHATSDMGWAADRLGESRIKGAYAYRQLLDQLGWIPNGTDFPVEAIYPLYTFYAAVFRTGHTGEPSGGFQPENSLSRENALRSMTIWAAKASFEEDEKGSLEPGKWADFVVLDTDLMTADPKEVLKAKVESTWIAGEAVWDASKSLD